MDAIGNPFLNWLQSLDEAQDRAWRRRARERLLWPICHDQALVGPALDRLAADLMRAFAMQHRLKMTELLSLLEHPRSLALEALAHWAFRTDASARGAPSSIRQAG